MNNLDPKTAGQRQDHSTDGAVATVLVPLVSLAVVFELVSLLVSHSMLAAIH
ncbi:MAG TPA: hypothetical protein VIV34_01770 [Pseudolabrys sp.]